MHNPLHSPAGLYARAFLGAHVARMRHHWTDGERGASAIELAIITGVLVLLAIGVLTFVINEVTAGKNNINQTIPTPP